MSHVIDDAPAQPHGGPPPGVRRRLRRAHVAAVGTLLALFSLAVFAGPASASTSVTFTSYPLATQSAGPNAITTGPDGNLWTTDFFVGKISRINPTTGTVTDFTEPNAGCMVQIISGPDGNLWFVDLCNNFIGKITTDGVITEYPVPRDKVLTPWKRSGLGQAPASITVGADNNLWVSEFGTDRVVQLHTDGTYGKDFLLPRHHNLGKHDPDAAGADYITSGPDGNLWLTESRFGGGPNIGNRIARMTLDGVFTEFPIPTVDSRPHDIVVGPDNALWFTEERGNNVGRIDLSGNITEYAAPTANAIPDGITLGPDGALWFTEASGSAPGLGRVDTSGNVQEFNAPNPPPDPQSNGAIGICVGPDNNVWFTEVTTNFVVKTVISNT